MGKMVMKPYHPPGCIHLEEAREIARKLRNGELASIKFYATTSGGTVEAQVRGVAFASELENLWNCWYLFHNYWYAHAFGMQLLETHRKGETQPYIGPAAFRNEVEK